MINTYQQKYLPSGQLPQNKQQLYEEAMKTKLNTNLCREENIKLKTQIQQKNREVDRKDKMIQELVDEINNKQNKFQRNPQETHLSLSLKKQVKDLKEELKAKDEELIRYKKNLKASRMQEMEIEVKMLADECTKLKHVIEELMKDNSVPYTANEVAALEDKLKQQAVLLKNARQENNELANILQKKDDDVNELKETAVKLERRSAKLENDSKDRIKNKGNLKDNKKEIERLKEQLNLLKTDTKEKETATYKARIDELLRKQNDFMDKIKQKEKLLQNLEAKVQEATSPSKDGKSAQSMQNEIKQLKAKITNCKNINISM